MRRNERNKHKSSGLKNVLYIWTAVIIISIISFIVAIKVYSNNLKLTNESLQEDKIATIVKDEADELLEEASSTIGKNVEESENALQNITEGDNLIKENKINTNVVSTENEEEEQIVETKKEEVKIETVEEPVFAMPVEGEVIREFAKENLVYSETLQEWVTHNGIDIKAEKASIVKAAEDGTVTAIKNDPRYGTTVIIEHVNGYTTRYSNLLTAEFVVVGEKVIKGQTIGTVGNTAAFEIADDEHLHFEILKDNENLDPNLYIK